MNQNTENLDHLAEIRSMMEKSSKFISLSGLSGVSAGITALAGAFIAYLFLNNSINYPGYNDDRFLIFDNVFCPRLIFLGLIASLTLLISVGLAWYFSARKARKKGVKFWNKSAWRMVINLFFPLAAGGIFALVLIFHRVIWLVAPSMLIFYGLALLNAGKYTHNDIRFLGVSEIFLGLIACFFAGYGLIFWAIGFGLLHIVYGMVMYAKYDRNPE
jgi:hypothetical protein